MLERGFGYYAILTLSLAVNKRRRSRTEPLFETGKLTDQR